MVALLHILALVLYAAVAGVLLRSLLKGREGTTRAGAVLAVMAVVVHFVALGGYVLVHGDLPLVGLGPSLSTLAFLVGVFLVPATLLRRQVGPVGLVLAPLAVLLLVVAVAVGVVPAGEPLAFRGVWFTAHVVLAFLADACLAAAFAAGLLYLIQFRELKAKNFGKWFRFLPPLETLDQVGRVALAVGFPAFTLAIGLGWAWTVRFRHSLATTDPQVVWGMLTWAVFVVALLARRGHPSRRRRAALASVIGFAVVVVAYLLLRLSVADGRLFF
jgi:ABC-type uncharacterized transport system permease subunit